jgi:hypothetical protein
LKNIERLAGTLLGAIRPESAERMYPYSGRGHHGPVRSTSLGKTTIVNIPGSTAVGKEQPLKVYGKIG